MELIFKNTLFTKSKCELNLKIKENQIVGVLNGNINNICENKIASGQIKYNNFVLSKNTVLEKYYNMICLCKNEINELYSVNIMDYINKTIGYIDGAMLYDLFKKFELNRDLLDYPYTKLSTSERKKILLICALISGKDIIVFENPTHYLDYKSKEVLIRELKRLKRNKIIIIFTDDTEFLLKVTEKIIVKEKNNVMFGDKYEVLSNEELLMRNSLKVPDLLLFINMIEIKKNVKLGYRDNLNDTIKDVYRHV